jgi:hypothetical protein
MEITVKLYGGLKLPRTLIKKGAVKATSYSNIFSVKSSVRNFTPYSVMRILGYGVNEQKFISVAVNEKIQQPDRALKDRDELILSLPIGGG